VHRYRCSGAGAEVMVQRWIRGEEVQRCWCRDTGAEVVQRRCRGGGVQVKR